MLVVLGMGVTACAAGPPVGAPSPTAAASVAAVPPAPASAPAASPWPPLDAAGLERVRHTRVFFGHRSVGAGIVEIGIPAVFAQYGIPSPTPGGPFQDTWLVQTENPVDKMQDFDKIVRSEVGSTAEVAFMKLGYLDIDAASDVEAVFDAYRSMMRELAADYPDVVFLHVTITVTNWKPENSLALQRYNDLLRAEYGGAGRLIDLATVLSTCPDGHEERARLDDGQTAQQLCEEYSKDGGHLNQLGDEAAAAEVLRAVAAVSAAPAP